MGDVLDLLLPPRCAGCGGAGAVLCAACAAELAGGPRRRMPVPVPPGLPDCWSAAPYEGAARRAIIAYKERGRTALARPLAHSLAATLAASLTPSLGASLAASRDGRGARPPRREVVVVPVPGSPGGRRRRGHDPVGRIAALAVRRLRAEGWPVTLLAAVEHRRRVADQAGLSSSERAANLSAAYRIKKPAGVALRALCARSCTVALVDDVVTTGATLAETARVLREAGAHVPVAITLAATPRRHARASEKRGDHLA
ncbi:hypothetical protein Misp01_04570 [Microtetraspora sp. NBRC 13810]|uniref:ComF family protein n=1 Tax=Microtetraspora sp. NBRC 13810 TaxID=3030990 RepID=UPI0024A42AD6|nr:ComF family protein [Microtetraspora sp. NBRC 13810]GLW05327.1 hypothetical protein Misp01_04570 [Microtetraspora sp. NBRC 13810]